MSLSLAKFVKLQVNKFPLINCKFPLAFRYFLLHKILQLHLEALSGDIITEAVQHFVKIYLLLILDHREYLA